MTENDILDAVYTNVELDTSDWTTTSDEYLAGRRFSNQAISKWENAIIVRTGSQLPVRWRGLWGTLTDASDGTKTITAGTYTYSCPTNMKFPASYVRTVDSSGKSTYFYVVQIADVPKLAQSHYLFVYFTGNPKSGFTLHFNPNITLTTGHTINYEYYKTATTFTTTTSTTEMDDPYFIVSYVSAMFFKDEDAEQFKMYMDDAEARLDQMKSNNEIGYEGVDDPIQSTLTSSSASFGT